MASARGKLERPTYVGLMDLGRAAADAKFASASARALGSSDDDGIDSSRRERRWRRSEPVMAMFHPVDLGALFDFCLRVGVAFVLARRPIEGIPANNLPHVEDPPGLLVGVAEVGALAAALTPILPYKIQCYHDPRDTGASRSLCYKIPYRLAVMPFHRAEQRAAPCHADTHTER